LTANTTGTNITADYNANTGMLSLAGVDTVANYQQVLGTVTYTNTAPTPDTSDRTIEFLVNDGATHSNLSTLATTTVLFNSAPIANDDTVTTDEDTPVTITVLDNDSDPDNNTLNLSSIDTTNTQGIVTLNPDNTLTYNPDTAFQSLGHGETTTDSLTYTLSDGNGGTATATVTVTVTGINDTPTLTPINKTGDEDTVISFSANDFTTAFNDPEGTSLSQISVISLPNQGVLNLNGNTVQAGDEITVADLDNLTFTPDTDFNGTTSFVWNASDGTNFAAGTTVNMTINAVNDNPVATDDSATTTQDTAITIDVLANDSDPVEADPLHIDTFDLTSASGGTIILDDNSTPNDLTDDQLLYTPATGYIGADSFSYTLSDSNGGTATATVNVTVNPANSLTLIGTPLDDTLTADSGDDFLFGLGGNDVLQAKAGNDFLDGGDGDDVLSGDAGQDNLFGNLGNDLLEGGEGEDALDGGDGDDMLFGGDANDALFGQLGNDFLDGGDGNDYLDSGEGNDQVFGGNGNDMLLSNLGADFLRGGAGDDLLEAGEGNDILFGDADNDTLTGGAGDDLIRGDTGDDLLDGGVGNDGLFGGSGADQFLLRMGEGMDMVFDFSDGEDLFLLADGLTFAQLTITASSFSTLIQVQSSGELLATVFGVSANLIAAADFTLQ
ncbi:MAG: tandem-95 repeat protein, partial [Coleofasciculus sp. C2-GNP5-27]